MKFVNVSHLDTRQLRRLATALAKAQLDPLDVKRLKIHVRNQAGQRRPITYRYWKTSPSTFGRFDLLVKRGYVPDSELAWMISHAIVHSFGGRASKIQDLKGYTTAFPVDWQQKKVRVKPEVPEAAQIAAKTKKKKDEVTKEIAKLKRRVKYRATKMKRIQTLQKKDERRLKYLEKVAANVTADLDLADAEAELEREAVAEREAAAFTKPSQTQGWIDVIKAIGEESR